MSSFLPQPPVFILPLLPGFTFGLFQNFPFDLIWWFSASDSWSWCWLVVLFWAPSEALLLVLSHLLQTTHYFPTISRCFLPSHLGSLKPVELFLQVPSRVISVYFNATHRPWLTPKMQRQNHVPYKNSMSRTWKTNFVPQLAYTLDHNLKTAHTFFSAFLSFTVKWHWCNSFPCSLSLLLTKQRWLNFHAQLPNSLYIHTSYIVTPNLFPHAFIQHFYSIVKEWSIQAITCWCYPRVNCSVSVQRCLCHYLDVYYILSYYFIKMNRKQKKESADTSDKKYSSCKQYLETKMKIIKQPEDRESFTLIWFSLDLGRSIVCSIN